MRQRTAALLLHLLLAPAVAAAADAVAPPAVGVPSKPESPAPAPAPRPDNLEFFRGASVRHPADQEVLIQLGYLSLEAGNTEEALSAFAKALKQDQGSYDASLGRGMALYLAARFREAEVELLRAVRLDQDPAGARYWLGMTYEKLGMKDMALTQYQAGLGIAPDSSAAPAK